MSLPVVEISLPPWVGRELDSARAYPAVEDRARLVIRLARLNVCHGGGPFGAAVFDRATHRLVAAGVNLVARLNCSVAHAEIVAIALAQRTLGSYDLGRAGEKGCELVASAEPCAMCMGAIPWSGVRSLACGARGEDVCAAGFDEGAKPADWVAAFEARGIEVRQDVCRAESVAVLEEYRRRGGLIYNTTAVSRSCGRSAHSPRSVPPA